MCDVFAKNVGRISIRPWRMESPPTDRSGRRRTTHLASSTFHEMFPFLTTETSSTQQRERESGERLSSSSWALDQHRPCCRWMCVCRERETHTHSTTTTVLLPGIVPQGRKEKQVHVCVCVERKVGLGKNIKPPPGVFFIFLSFSPAKKKEGSIHTHNKFFSFLVCAWRRDQSQQQQQPRYA